MESESALARDTRKEHRFATTGITKIIRMRVRRMDIMGRAGLAVECLSARARGIAPDGAADIMAATDADSTDAESIAVDLRVAADSQDVADSVVVRCAVEADSTAVSATAADPAAAADLAVVVGLAAAGADNRVSG